MNKPFLFFAFLFFAVVPSKAQSWSWAFGCNGAGDGEAMATDAAGNVFIAGEFDGPLIAGTNSISSAELATYLIKFNSSGTPLWARASSCTGNTNNDYIITQSVCTDGLGNSYIAGYFKTPFVCFGTYTLNGSINGDSPFIAKYSPSGNILWARTATSNPAGVNKAYSLSADAVGNVYLTGAFTSPTISFGTNTLTNFGFDCGFLTKYDQNGNDVWAIGTVGAGSDEARSVSTDTAGNIVLCGFHSSGLTSWGSYTMSYPSGNLFISKISPQGNVLWLQSSTGFGNTASISTDDSLNIYLSGVYSSPPLSFGTYSVNNTNGNIFVFKFNSSGNALWAITSNNTSTSNILPYTTSAYNNGVVIAGAMDSFGAPLIIGTNTLSSPSNSVDPAFFAQFDRNGNLIYSESFFSGGDDWFGACTDKFCHIYVSGDFYGGSLVIGTTTLSQLGGEDPFVAKYTFSCQGIPDHMEERSVGSNLTIYPNPNSGQFIVQTNSSARFEVINITGEIILSSEISEGKNNFDLKNFSKGIYFYRISSEEKVFRGKMVVE
jgi:hypothetical protein